MSDPKQPLDADEPFDLERAPLDRPRGFDIDWGGDGSDPMRPVRAHVLAALPVADRPYQPPLDALVTLGDADVDDLVAEHGIGQAHAAELVCMVRDRALATAPPGSPASWAPFHALKILAGLDLAAQVADLLPIFETGMDELADELIWTLGDVGAPAVAPLLAYFDDRTRWGLGRSRAANALEAIARQFPETRDGIVAALADLVRRAADEPEGLVSLTVACLLGLKAVEALPIIRRAYEIGKVDETVPGTWGTILEELGVEPDPDDPLVEESRRRFEERHAQMFPRGPYGSRRAVASAGPGQAPGQKRKQDQARKDKNKRKAAKASRKANRKKRK